MKLIKLNNFVISYENHYITNKDGDMVYNEEIWPYKIKGDIDQNRLILYFKNSIIKCIDKDGKYVFNKQLRRRLYEFKGTYLNAYFMAADPRRNYDMYDIETDNLIKENVLLLKDIFFYQQGCLAYYKCDYDGKFRNDYHIIDKNFNEVYGGPFSYLKQFKTKNLVKITQLLKNGLFKGTKGFHNKKIVLVNEEGKITKLLPATSDSIRIKLCERGYAFFKENNEIYKIDENLNIENVTQPYNKCKEILFRFIKENNLYKNFTKALTKREFPCVDSEVDSMIIYLNLRYNERCNIKSIEEFWNNIIKETFQSENCYAY